MTLDAVVTFVKDDDGDVGDDDDDDAVVTFVKDDDDDVGDYDEKEERYL